MIIDHSSISLSSQRSYSFSRSVQETLQFSGGTLTSPRPETSQSADRVNDRVNLSRNSLQVGRVDLDQPAPAGDERLIADFNTRLLKELFERLTGRTFQVFSPWGNSGQELGAAAEQEAGEAQTGANFSLIYRYEENTVESERTVFTGAGQVTTADGRTIAVELSVAMSREFVSRNSLELRAGEALKDPLVINFGGNASQLTAAKYAFDIDSDGLEDQISFVGEGSGFLALDNNNDGQVTNGSELFGAHSGDGFADLRAYDGDGNNWIDERDAVYHQLRIWLKDAAGRDQLLALGQVGVGALYLGSVGSEFAVKNSQNQLLGQIRQSGLALLESGKAVSMQQIDLAV